MGFIQSKTSLNIESALTVAIDRYYQELKTNSLPAKNLLKSGFVGCGEAKPDLSSNYKELIADELSQKHDHR